MLILTYFNPIIGPDILYSIPPKIETILSEEALSQIKRMMDTATPGFFAHRFSAELNTANFFFLIPSQWARGKQEMIMVTKIVEEDAPDLKAYESEFQNFISNLKNNRTSIFKAFYKKNPPLNYQNEIDEEFTYLTQEFNSLAKFFSITQAQTHGILLPKTLLRKHHALHLPGGVIRDLEKSLGEQKNYFVVFQKRKDNFKIDIFPYAENKMIKIAVVFNGQLSPETLRQISLIFQEMNMPFVHTSGICQQGGRCIYEVYLNPKEATNFEGTKERLRLIQDVDDVKIIEIDVTKEN